MSDDNASPRSNASAIKAGPTIYKNVKAYWEDTIRDGLFLPAFSSKFINEKTITAMKNGDIIRIRQDQVVFRICMTPPSKQVLINKFKTYVDRLNYKSGIDMDRGNYPDKAYLVLAIATLSGGKDEIFESNYVPSREIFGAVKQPDQQFNQNIAAHLIGSGKGRHLKLGGITKEEKVAHQIKVSEASQLKQAEKQERLKKELELHKAKDKAAVLKLQEREDVRKEVHAQFQASANTYVSEQIA